MFMLLSLIISTSTLLQKVLKPMEQLSWKQCMFTLFAVPIIHFVKTNQPLMSNTFIY